MMLYTEPLKDVEPDSQFASFNSLRYFLDNHKEIVRVLFCDIKKVIPACAVPSGKNSLETIFNQWKIRLSKNNPQTEQNKTKNIEIQNTKGDHLATINLTDGIVTFTAVAKGIKVFVTDSHDVTEVHDYQE